MSAGDTVRRLWALFHERKWDEARALLSDDFEVVWPQSREHIVGPDNYIAINREYPGTHEIDVLKCRSASRRIVGTETLIRSAMPDGRQLAVFAISFFEVRDGKIASATEYWAETYPAPEWWRRYVRLIGPSAKMGP